MAIMIDNEWEALPDGILELIEKVIDKTVELENCPYAYEVSVVITDNEGIKEVNKTYRDKDMATDVLSFPLIPFDEPSDFSSIDEDSDECFNLDTGELMLGDMILSFEKAESQAMEYGHSIVREVAFLVIHSMLHLFGYDHIEEEDEALMLKRQQVILDEMGISRG